MKIALKISIARLIIVQLIPIIGLIFFDWTLFDLSVLYLLESMAMFFVFNFHQYFVQEKTRYPFGFALIQLLFSLVFFSGLIFAFLVVLYVATGESKFGHFQDHMYHRLMLMNFWYVLLFMIILEFITFYLKISKSSTMVNLNFFRVIKRIFFSYAFVVGSLVLMMLTMGNTVILFSSLVLMKIAFEISMEDPRILAYFRNKWAPNRMKTKE